MFFFNDCVVNSSRTSFPNCLPHHPVCFPVNIVFPRDVGVYVLPALTNPLYPPIPPSNPPANANHGVVLVPYLVSIASPSFCPPYAPANPVAVVVIAGTHPIIPAVKGNVAIVLKIPAVVSPFLRNSSCLTGSVSYTL